MDEELLLADDTAAQGAYRERASKPAPDPGPRTRAAWAVDATPLVASGRRAVTERRGDAFDGADERVRNAHGDVVGVPLVYEVRKRAVELFDLGKTAKEVADACCISRKTATKLRNDVVAQGLQKGHDGRTVGVPVPGKQGGWRWSRMDERQQVACCQLAVEHPRWTVAQIRTEMERMFVADNLRLSDSTVWRALNRAKLQNMRAILKDPRRDDTPAHAAELVAFKAEQAKGRDGLLHSEDLFFMDETIVYLNETQKRGWGARGSRGPTITQAKGKTKTIAVYAGLGLVSGTLTSAALAVSRGLLKDDEVRGNHLRYDADTGEFEPGERPQFALVWWICPPRREYERLSPFLDVEDLRDPSYRLPKLTEITNMDQGSLLSADWFCAAEAEQASSLAGLINFVRKAVREGDETVLRSTLWLCGVEEKMVDEEGNLMKLYDRQGISDLWIRGRPDQLRRRLQAFTVLLCKLAGEELADEKDVTPAELDAVPRAYYTSFGRRSKGGVTQSVRGDRAMFQSYLRKVKAYYDANFPPTVRERLRMAWDAASSHGHVEVTANKMSFMHAWARQELGVRGAIFLPVRSPDYNPVELLFSYVKSSIRRRTASASGEVGVADMVRLIDTAMLEVTKPMVEGWVSHGCYQVEGRLLGKTCPDEGAERELEASLALSSMDVLSKELREMDAIDPQEVRNILLDLSRPEEKDALFTIFAELPTNSDAAWVAEALRGHGLHPPSDFSLSSYQGKSPGQRLSSHDVLIAGGGAPGACVFENVKPAWKRVRDMVAECSKNGTDGAMRCARLHFDTFATPASASYASCSKALSDLHAEVFGQDGVLGRTQHAARQVMAGMASSLAEEEQAKETLAALAAEENGDFTDDHIDWPGVADTLRATPYANSLLYNEVDDGASLGGAGKRALATIAVCAFERERERTETIARNVAKLLRKASKGGYTEEALSKLSSQLAGQLCALRRVVCDGAESEQVGVQPSGAPTRSEGASNMHAAQLAGVIDVERVWARQRGYRRRDKGGQRWPGYPEEEPGGKEVVLDGTARPIQIKTARVEVLEDGSTCVLRVRTEDGKTKDLPVGTKDKLQRSWREKLDPPTRDALFSRYSPENVRIAENAFQIFEENTAKEAGQRDLSKKLKTMARTTSARVVTTPTGDHLEAIHAMQQQTEAQLKMPDPSVPALALEGERSYSDLIGSSDQFAVRFAPGDSADYTYLALPKSDSPLKLSCKDWAAKHGLKLQVPHLKAFRSLPRFVAHPRNRELTALQLFHAASLEGPSQTPDSIDASLSRETHGNGVRLWYSSEPSPVQYHPVTSRQKLRRVQKEQALNASPESMQDQLYVFTQEEVAALRMALR